MQAPDVAQPQLDPEEAEREKRRRERRFHLITVPQLRLGGFALMVALIAVGHVTGAIDATWRGTLGLGAGLITYSFISWAALWLWFEAVDIVNLGNLFLAVDLVAFTVAIDLTGGDRSWLYVLLFIRVADQTNRSFRRALAFGALSVACYAALLAYLAFVDHRAIAWPTETFKLLLLAGANFYMAMTARTAERLRAQLRDAIRLARRLVGELREQSQQLDLARTKAVEASRIKTEFLSNMSHEFHTPINGILSLMTLLLRSGHGENRRDLLELAHQSAQSLVQMVNDVLDLSKLEAGRLRVDSARFLIREELDRAMRAAGQRARAKGLDFVVHVAPAVPEAIVTDWSHVRQILMNLVDNAVAFTERGSVHVDVTLVSRDADHAVLQFTVLDTGVGIPPDRQITIFDAFVKSDGSAGGGTGLGLAIAKRLIEALGGDIWLNSEPGRATAFSFTVPLRLSEPGSAEAWPEPPDARTAPSRPIRVIVGADNAGGQPVVRLLERLGHTVTAVDSGREALARVASRQFDLAIFDVQMPEIDGLEATSIIRLRERTKGGRLPIIALLSSAADAPERDRYLRGGMDGALECPVAESALAGEIRRVTQ